LRSKRGFIEPDVLSGFGDSNEEGFGRSGRLAPDDMFVAESGDARVELGFVDADQLAVRIIDAPSDQISNIVMHDDLLLRNRRQVALPPMEKS